MLRSTEVEPVVPKTNQNYSTISIHHYRWSLKDHLEFWRHASRFWHTCQGTLMLANAWLWQHVVLFTILYVHLHIQMRCLPCGKAWNIQQVTKASHVNAVIEAYMLWGWKQLQPWEHFATKWLKWCGSSINEVVVLNH